MPEHRHGKDSGRPEQPVTSESEEMYLITVARVLEEGRPAPVPLAVIADDLGVSVASANEMVRKLARRGLLAYQPYRGVELSEHGGRVAGRVLRIRRLWSTFLADHLGLSPTAADAQACHLEHVTSPQAADRLAAFLGDPESDPLGRPIPLTAGAPAPNPTSIPLTEASAGEVVEVVSIAAPAAAAKFAAAAGIVPGAHLTVAGVGAAAVLVDAGALIELGDAIAGAIGVRPIGRTDEA